MNSSTCELAARKQMGSGVLDSAIFFHPQEVYKKVKKKKRDASFNSPEIV